MPDPIKPEQNFIIKNCSLATIATGESARSLIELRDRLTTVNEGCIYNHFWGARMNPQFIHHQHHNDFASWVFHRLHDQVLAEKLSIIDPTEFNTLEDLRQEILETIDKQLDEYEIVLWTTKEDRFHFVRSTIVTFESPLSISHPEKLAEVIDTLTPSSIFYHFIDARTRTPEKVDDFSVWLKNFGDQYNDLIETIQAIDPYFLSLKELRNELAKSFKSFFQTRGQA
jgi:hypothetical protein